MKRLLLGLVALFSLFVFPQLYAQMPGNSQKVQGAGGCGSNAPAAIVKNEDVDGDGVPNSVDNCPNEFNPHQTDLDGQLGVGDLCETLSPESPDSCDECAGPEDCPDDKPLCTEGCCLAGVACGDGLWEPDGGEQCEYISAGPGIPSTAVGCDNCDPVTCLCLGGGNEPLCGNFALEEDEACDFVMTDDGPAAQGACNFEGGETCNPNICICEVGNTEPICGNSNLDEGEACDFVMTRGGPQPQGNCDFAGGESCVDCECVATVCGDGSITGSETCDFISGPRGSTPILINCLDGQFCDSQTCQCSGGSLDVCGDGTITGAESCDFSMDGGIPTPILGTCQAGDSCGEPETPQQCQCIAAGQDFCDDAGCPGACDTSGSITFCNDSSCGGPGINCESDTSVCDAFEPIFELPLLCDGTCCVPED